MEKAKLEDWLNQDRTELKSLIRSEVSKQVTSLKSRHPGLYGYSILPGETYEAGNLVSVWNLESNIGGDGAYYRYSVDEWEHWDHNALKLASIEIDRLNKKFRMLHPEDANSFELDRYEIAHIKSIHTAILEALVELKKESLFEGMTTRPFVAIWISDSDHEIVKQSVKKLNPETVVQEFESEF